MKKLILFSVLVLSLGYKSYSQQISQYVFSSGSGEITTILGEYVKFTIGQSFYTETLSDNNGTFLTQGFEQPMNRNNIASLAPNFPDVDSVKIIVFPNPAVNYTNLELNIIDNDGAEIILIDMWGRILKTQEFKIEKGNQKLRFTFDFLAAGVYTLKVNANQKVYAKKLIINTAGYTVSP